MELRSFQESINEKEREENIILENLDVDSATRKASGARNKDEDLIDGISCLKTKDNIESTYGKMS
jgi:hypothetical protein